MSDTTEPLTIDVVSDVVCPCCFIGKRRLEKAVASRPDLSVEVRFHPYFLNDWVPRGGISRTEYLTTKFGSVDRYNQNAQRIVGVAAGEGLTYAPEKIQRQPNTIDCHRLIYWAEQQGDGARMKQRLMDLYFTEGGDLSDREVLVKAAADCGLDANQVRDMLATDTDVDTVTRAAESAKAAGIEGVPMYIFGGMLAVSGAQSPEHLVSAIERAIAEREKRATQAAE
ncbi:MAG TPA: DsbA family oxidoreductase [Xanthobacteraceae bacterium]|jgi:predicted DsbA family dithiol-disulfide isomerase